MLPTELSVRGKLAAAALGGFCADHPVRKWDGFTVSVYEGTLRFNDKKIICYNLPCSFFCLISTPLFRGSSSPIRGVSSFSRYCWSLMSHVQAFDGSGSEKGQIAVVWWEAGQVQWGQRKYKSVPEVPSALHFCVGCDTQGSLPEDLRSSSKGIKGIWVPNPD